MMVGCFGILQSLEGLSTDAGKGKARRERRPSITTWPLSSLSKMYVQREACTPDERDTTIISEMDNRIDVKVLRGSSYPAETMN